MVPSATSTCETGANVKLGGAWWGAAHALTHFKICFVTFFPAKDKSGAYLLLF